MISWRGLHRADVIRAVDFAHSQQLPVAVRGGGHSFIGKSVCDGGIVIDLSQMKGIRVDPVTCTVQAEAGLTLGEFVREIQPFGLVTTTGTVAGTGLSGLTLGGGLGWFMGKYVGLMRSKKERETRPPKPLEDACYYSATERQWWKSQRDEAN